MKSRVARNSTRRAADIIIVIVIDRHSIAIAVTIAVTIAIAIAIAATITSIIITVPVCADISYSCI